MTTVTPPPQVAGPAARRPLRGGHDRTRSVAERYQNGCFLVGRAGTGKTRLVTDELDRLGATWTYRSACMSAMGLYSLLEEHPENTIVIDDIGSLFNQWSAHRYEVPHARERETRSRLPLTGRTIATHHRHPMPPHACFVRDVPDAP